MGHIIEQTQFGRWLELWYTTIDTLFADELAGQAKNDDRIMSTKQYVSIWNALANKAEYSERRFQTLMKSL